MASVIGFFLDFSLTWLSWFIVFYIGIRIYAKIRKIDDYKKLVVRGCWVAIVFGLILAVINIYDSSDKQYRLGYEDGYTLGKRDMTEATQEAYQRGYDEALAFFAKTFYPSANAASDELDA